MKAGAVTKDAATKAATASIAAAMRIAMKIRATATRAPGASPTLTSTAAKIGHANSAAKASAARITATKDSDVNMAATAGAEFPKKATKQKGRRGVFAGPGPKENKGRAHRL